MYFRSGQRRMMDNCGEGLTVRKRRWMAAEVAQVAARYAAEGPGDLASDLGRTVPAVTSLANRMGLRSLNRRLKQSRTRLADTRGAWQAGKDPVQSPIAAGAVPAAAPSEVEKGDARTSRGRTVAAVTT